DAWGVDVLAVGSQKGLMVPPGLSFLSVSDRARGRLAKARNPRFYLSVDRALAALEKGALPDTPFTPAVSLILQLREAVRAIEREGLTEVWKRTARLGEATRAAVVALGLKLLASRGQSNVVTAVDCAGGPDPDEIVKRMRDEFGVSLIGGQGKLKGKIFRIGHVGHVDELDVLATIAALEMVLSGLGRSVALGSGVAAAQRSFLGERVAVRAG
ncbi:MAG: aminotransferase class V-fold PLP-dependent enzyme, partial [bacterium]